MSVRAFPAPSRHPLRWLREQFDVLARCERLERENVELRSLLADAMRSQDRATAFIEEATGHLRSIGTPEAHSETWPCRVCVEAEKARRAPRVLP